jgi:hypothetical protein
MSKRFLAILITLIVLAFGASAYALAPMLLTDGSTDAIAISDGETPKGAPDSQSDIASADGDSELGAEGELGAEDEDGTGEGDASGGEGGSGDGSGGTSDAGSGSASGARSNSGSDPSTSNGGNGSNAKPTPEPQLTVTISIDAETMGRGYIMAPRSAAFSSGETVFDVLSRECRSSGIPMEHSFNPLYNSVYVEGIDNLYEFDGGSRSGWMYSVNGWYPNYGCSVYTVNDGDVIKWRYTCDYGNDIGGGYAVGE